MKILAKRVGRPPQIEDIPNELEALQTYVGGYIEPIWLPVTCGEVSCFLICDEEGLISDKHFNCKLFGHQLFGNVLICGGSGETFCDFPYADDSNLCKLLFPELWEGYHA